MIYKFYEDKFHVLAEKALHELRNNLVKVAVGRANPFLISSLTIAYYGTPTPIGEICAITVPESRQLLVKPFDLAITKDVASVINSSSLGLYASNEGHQLRITFPEVTTERRREVTKGIVQYAEQARVHIRAARQDINKLIKSDSELPEDETKRYLDNIQKMVDRYNADVDKLATEKEREIMTV